MNAERKSLFACPDCEAGFDSMMAVLAHCQDVHASEHPGQEPVARSTAWEIVWADEDD